MQPRSFRSVRRPNSQSGMYLALVSVAALALLALAGLAIDSARLYLTKRQLQLAVDAAGIAGAQLMMGAPSVALEGSNSVESRTIAILKENLLQAGYSDVDSIVDGSLPGARVKICFNNAGIDSLGNCPSGSAIPADDVRRSIHLYLNFAQPTLLLGHLPGFADSVDLSAHAHVVNFKMQVVLVVDGSGSMYDPIASPPTGCSGANAHRMCALQVAANALIDAMLPFDEIGLVQFGGGPLANGAHRPYQPVVWQANHAEPDGAPASWGAVWNNYKADSVRRQPMTQLVDITGDNRPGIKGVINSLGATGTTNLGSGIWRARNVLNVRGTLPANTIRVMVILSDGIPNLNSSSTPQYPMSNSYGGHRQIYDHPLVSPAQPCTSKWVDTAPGNLLSPDPPNWHPEPPLPPPTSIPIFQRLAFLDAVGEVDRVLDDGTLIYTIGIGVPGAGDVTVDSPFTHLNLMQRLANSQSELQLNSPGEGLVWAGHRGLGEWPAPALVPYLRDFPCVKTGQELLSKPIGRFQSVVVGTIWLKLSARF